MKKKIFGVIIWLFILSILTCQSAAAETTLVISEIMQNPSTVSDANGEWLEVYNPAENSVNLKNIEIRDDDTTTHIISADLWVSSKEYAVLCRNSDSTSNGGVSCNYGYTRISLTNGAREISLFDKDTLIDVVRYDGGATFPDPTGASMALKNPGLDNSAGVNWCASKTPFGDGDLGTPGRANDCTPSEEIPEFPSAALPFFIAGAGYIFLRRKKAVDSR